MSQEWIHMQDKYSIQQSNKKFIQNENTSIVTKIWHATYQVWINRCEEVHQNPTASEELYLKEQLKRKVKEL